ncbi:MAG: AAA family ATPase [Actinomycetota bacterium]
MKRTRGSSHQPTLRPGAAPFIGREREMTALLEGLEDAGAGRGRLFLVAGEPGIGKSRLADEFTEQASTHGKRVLWGRCWEAGGAPPYWPWIQALRPYLRDSDPEELRSLLQDHPELGLLMPELETYLGEASVRPTTDPEAARFRLFDAVAALLWKASEGEPLVIVIDDLHAADAPSLLLLRFVAAELARVHILILCTYRDIDVAPDSSLADTLPELLREPAARHLHLQGLTRVDVAALIREISGLEPSRRVVEQVVRQTEGNPLFAGEVIPLLISEGGLQDDAVPLLPLVPDSARDFITRRLARLSPDSADLLSIASVLGRDFSLDVLQGLSGLSRPDVLVRLEEARGAHIVGPLPGAVDRLRFSHALIRDAIYEDISLQLRPELHARAGETLRERYAENLGPHLVELAAHFFAAIPTGGAERAIEYAAQAAQWSLHQLAYEEAARLYRTALEALELARPVDLDRRCDLLLALGDADLLAGGHHAAKIAFLDAAQMARTSGSSEKLARAAIGYGGRFVWMRAGNDRHLVPLLEEALEAVGKKPSELRVQLLARLAGALRDQADRAPREAISHEALEMARGLGDPATLAYALVSRYTANWGPETAEEQLEIADELVELSEKIGNRDREVEGHLLLVKAHMTLGNLTGVYAAMEASSRLAAELKQPSQQWHAAVDRATLALFEGRFRAAEKLSEEVYRLGRRALGRDPEVAYRLHLFILRKEQGRLQEVEELIRRSVDDYPWYPMFRCVVANLYATLGRESQARDVLSGLAERGKIALPKDNEWLFAVSFLAEVVGFLGDVDTAQSLYEQLAPYEHLNAYSPPEMCTGSVARYLGILAAALGRWDTAAEHFLRAIDSNTRMGARPWAAHASTTTVACSCAEVK